MSPAQSLPRALALLVARPWRTLSAVMLIALALALPLLAATLAWSLQPLAPRLAPVGVATVFAAPGTSTEELRTLQSRLAAVAGVVDVAPLPRDAALADLTQRSGLPLADLRSNPLPDAFTLRLSGLPAAQDAAVTAARALPRVDGVQHDGNWVRRLASGGRAVATAAAALGGLALAVSVALAVAVLRRLTRVDPHEREVLSLLGAAPRLVGRAAGWQGLLAAGIGALLAAGLVALAMRVAAPLAAEVAAVFGTTAGLSLLPLPWLAAVVGVTAMLGGLIGRWSAR